MGAYSCGTGAWQVLSTGGTAKTLRDAGCDVKDVADHTGHPEMMDGRVKTLHPKVHGGLLSIRGNPTHEQACADHGIQHIDLVCVNLYPFQATVAKGEAFPECVENIGKISEKSHFTEATSQFTR